MLDRKDIREFHVDLLQCGNVGVLLCEFDDQHIDFGRGRDGDNYAVAGGKAVQRRLALPIGILKVCYRDHMVFDFVIGNSVMRQSASFQEGIGDRIKRADQQHTDSDSLVRKAGGELVRAIPDAFRIL